MKKIYSWIKVKNNREVASFVGGAIVVIIGAGWTLYTHFLDSTDSPARSVNEPGVAIEASPVEESIEPVEAPNANNEEPNIGKRSGSVKIEEKYVVCNTDNIDNCPPSAVFLPCGIEIAEWSNEQCGKLYQFEHRSRLPGGLCGTLIAEVTCEVATDAN